MLDLDRPAIRRRLTLSHAAGLSWADAADVLPAHYLPDEREDTLAQLRELAAELAAEEEES